MRLYCDNINDFIAGINHHYSVKSDQFERGKAITLFSDFKECDFRIKNIIHFKEYNVLSLEKIGGSEHERDVVGSYYGLTNPLD